MPENYARVRHKQRDIVLAYGRDPNFPGWPDTFQLNYGNPATQEAMIGELMKVARQCDGVRCDMANLVLPDVFERTWGVRRNPSGRGQSSACGTGSRPSASWPRLIGIWNGPCSSKASITHTISGSTTVSATVRPGQCANTLWQAWTIRTSWPAFWRTMTNRGRRRPFRQKFTRRRPSSHFSARGCGFSTRVNSRDERNTSPPFVPGAGRTHQRSVGTILHTNTRRHAATGGALRAMAIAPVRAGLGRQLDLGLYSRFRMARPGCATPAGDRELCGQPEPVLRSAAVFRPWRSRVAAPGLDRRCHLRSGRQGPSRHADYIWIFRPGRPRSSD